MQSREAGNRSWVHRWDCSQRLFQGPHTVLKLLKIRIFSYNLGMGGSEEGMGGAEEGMGEEGMGEEGMGVQRKGWGCGGRDGGCRGRDGGAEEEMGGAEEGMGGEEEGFISLFLWFLVFLSLRLCLLCFAFPRFSFDYGSVCFVFGDH